MYLVHIFGPDTCILFCLYLSPWYKESTYVFQVLYIFKVLTILSSSLFRILRWVREEEEYVKANNGSILKCVILDMTGMSFASLAKFVIEDLLLFSI